MRKADILADYNIFKLFNGIKFKINISVVLSEFSEPFNDNRISIHFIYFTAEGFKNAGVLPVNNALIRWRNIQKQGAVIADGIKINFKKLIYAFNCFILIFGIKPAFSD